MFTKLAMSGSLFIGSLLHSSNSNMMASNSSSLLSVVAAMIVGPQTTSCRRMERTGMDSAAGSIATAVSFRSSGVSTAVVVQAFVHGEHSPGAGLDADMTRIQDTTVFSIVTINMMKTATTICPQTRPSKNTEDKLDATTTRSAEKTVTEQTNYEFREAVGGPACRVSSTSFGGVTDQSRGAVRESVDARARQLGRRCAAAAVGRPSCVEP